MQAFSYHEPFFLTQSIAVNVSNAPQSVGVSPLVPHSLYRLLFIWSALHVHHNAALISSSIREDRLCLSLLTYSSETTLLFELWWTDVWSRDGLSCCIMSGDEKKAWSTPCIHWFSIKLKYASVVHKLYLHWFLVGWLIVTSGILLLSCGVNCFHTCGNVILLYLWSTKSI